MAGLWTRPSVARVAATSASLVSRPYCAAITSYPSACSGPVSLFQHEPSAQIPWQNTILGLVGVDIIPPYGVPLVRLSASGLVATVVPRLRSVVGHFGPTRGASLSVWTIAGVDWRDSLAGGAG